MRKRVVLASILLLAACSSTKNDGSATSALQPSNGEKYKALLLEYPDVRSAPEIIAQLNCHNPSEHRLICFGKADQARASEKEETQEAPNASVKTEDVEACQGQLASASESDLSGKTYGITYEADKVTICLHTKDATAPLALGSFSCKPQKAISGLISCTGEPPASNWERAKDPKSAFLKVEIRPKD